MDVRLGHNIKVIKKLALAMHAAAFFSTTHKLRGDSDEPVERLKDREKRLEQFTSRLAVMVILVCPRVVE